MRKKLCTYSVHFMAAAMLGIGLGSLPAQAETSARDVEVAARAVAFLASKPSGAQPTAIVYDPDNAESAADAQALQAILSGGVNAGKVTLSAPKMVAVGDLAGLSGMQVAFIAQGTNAHHAAIAQAAAAEKILTMSADLDCVRANHCVVGVQGQPSVEIYISKQASQASGQAFSSAFLMMAKEI
ncbi:MAG: hypothetical protein Tsb0016_27190 [Sphingomonadales bacterium]